MSNRNLRLEFFKPQELHLTMGTLVSVIGLVPLALAGVGFWAALRAWQGRRVSAVLTRSSLGLALTALAFVTFALGLNLTTYLRLVGEQSVAQIAVGDAGQGAFEVALSTSVDEAGGESGPASIPSVNRWRLVGDEWQLEARVIKWRGYMALFGVNAQYRLERLSGRYSDIEKARATPPSVHALSTSVGVDVWALARRFADWIPALDTVYGSAVYMPLVAGAEYSVHLSQSGLVARPTNEIAEQAVGRWR